MVRSEALKKAQIKYRENNRQKINEYFRNYEKEHYVEKKKDKKKEYYQINKDKIKARYFEDTIFTGYRRMFKEDYR